MNIEQVLCRAFCDGISVTTVPAGLAVSTGFEDASGDRIGFYLTRDTESGLWRIEDDGSLVPTLVATGVNVFKGARAKLFQSLLDQGRIEYDAAAGELRTGLLKEEELPNAATRFVALLLRVASLSATHPEVVSANFREDAVERIKRELGQQFVIREDEPLSPGLAEFEPDVLLTAPDLFPVAVFVAVSDQRLYEAIFMQMAAEHEVKIPCAVVALIDRDGSKLTSKKMRERASNRLDAMPTFYSEEAQAIARIAKEAYRTHRVI
jgi:hypothetical protein